MSIAVFNNRNNSAGTGILRFTCAYYYDDTGSGYDAETIWQWGYYPPLTNPKQINASSIVTDSEGAYSGLDDGAYVATQDNALSTTTGAGAQFTLNIEDDEVVSYSQVTGVDQASGYYTLGSGYTVGDQVVLTISNAGEITPMAINILTTSEWQTPATLLSTKSSSTYDIVHAWSYEGSSYGGGYRQSAINVNSNKTGTAFPKPIIKIYDETLGLPETDANAIYIQDTSSGPDYWTETSPGVWAYTLDGIGWVDGHDFKIVMTKP